MYPVHYREGGPSSEPSWPKDGKSWPLVQRFRPWVLIPLLVPCILSLSCCIVYGCYYVQCSK
ncbi:hypothetical protein LX32DRAFT_79744 [Colletotrichum zoysiae]|uniref:Uncharacterized protein n=1 Tax=Colletotrichum zoysiae TaxID=1216348 RepID=A0AAD9HBJ6_9PEZI|nr:hypothetical protein LX32DRAFT_79744 [Colletotrichum zoysiae]